MLVKECSCCHKLLPLDMFTKNKRGKLGRTSMCKECYTLRYKHSKKGLIAYILAKQKVRSKLRNHPLPKYTWIDLYNWFWSQPSAEQLYENWVKSGFDLKLKPSIDRLDDYKPYSLDNIQLVTYQENIDKYKKDQKEGINTKSCKAVDQYTLDGKFIKTYPSIAIASRQTNISSGNISNVANGTKIKRTEPNGTIWFTQPKQAGGFKWKYHEED